MGDLKRHSWIISEFLGGFFLNPFPSWYSTACSFTSGPLQCRTAILNHLGLFFKAGGGGKGGVYYHLAEGNTVYICQVFMIQPVGLNLEPKVT